MRLVVCGTIEEGELQGPSCKRIVVAVIQGGKRLKKATIFSVLIAGAVALTGPVEGDQLTKKMASGAMLTNACVACHGSGGHSGGPAIPSIAGLSFNYFVGTFLSFKHYDDPKKLAEVLAGDPELEDLEAYPRYGTVMTRIAKGYTLAEIKEMGQVFKNAKPIPAMQKTNPTLVELGGKIHKESCEDCHKGGGSVADSDAGILAGQWGRYLSYVLADFTQGRSKMPKRMKEKIAAVQTEYGHEGIKALVEYYASLKK